MTKEERELRDEFKALFSFGNLKLGKDTMIFNMTSATNCASKKLGMCKVGGVCYALKAEKMYKNVLPHRCRQMDYWDKCSADEFLEAVSWAKNSNIKYLRVNESGDLRGQHDIDKLNVIAKELKEKHNIITYLYTARKDLNFKDAQFIINGSSWMADNEFRFIPKSYLKVPYNDFKDNPTISKLKRDNDLVGTIGVICEGDCRVCSFCKSKLGLVIGVVEH